MLNLLTLNLKFMIEILIKKQTDRYLNIDKSKVVAYIFGSFILITLISVYGDKNSKS